MMILPVVRDCVWEHLDDATRKALRVAEPRVFGDARLGLDRAVVHAGGTDRIRSVAACHRNARSVELFVMPGVTNNELEIYADKGDMVHVQRCQVYITWSCITFTIPSGVRSLACCMANLSALVLVNPNHSKYEVLTDLDMAALTKLGKLQQFAASCSISIEKLSAWATAVPTLHTVAVDYIGSDHLEDNDLPADHILPDRFAVRGIKKLAHWTAIAGTAHVSRDRHMTVDANVLACFQDVAELDHVLVRLWVVPGLDPAFRMLRSSRGVILEVRGWDTMTIGAGAFAGVHSLVLLSTQPVTRDEAMMLMHASPNLWRLCLYPIDNEVTTVWFPVLKSLGKKVPELTIRYVKHDPEPAWQAEQAQSIVELTKLAGRLRVSGLCGV
jgi:hypothetical protein